MLRLALLLPVLALAACAGRFPREAPAPEAAPALVRVAAPVSGAAPARASPPRLHRCPVLPPPPAAICLRPACGWHLREVALAREPWDASEARRRACCRRRGNLKSGALFGVASVGVIGYGAAFWGYFSKPFDVASEDWFGEDTEYGGADKVGHLMTAYFGTAAAAGLHRVWGFSRREAALRGALVSMTMMTVVELGDATSEKSSFSYEDIVMDALGCAIGYVHEIDPWFNRVIDLRWEYIPGWGLTEGAEDLATDYSRASHLLAVNVGNLVSRRPGLLDLVDVQVGYTTRGYLERDPDPERWVYVGIGLNVANLLRRLRVPYAGFFDYFQVPYVSLRFGYELNDGDTGWLYGL